MIIKTDNDRQVFISKVNDVKLDKPWLMTAEPYKADRTAAQNALLNKWYQLIAKHTGDGFAYTRGYCKWTFGVPILLARGEPEFNALIDAIVNSMQYEQIIDLMGTEKISVSSDMNKTEFTEYLTMIEQDCANRQIPLLQGDEYNLAMGIK